MKTQAHLWPRNSTNWVAVGLGILYSNGRRIFSSSVFLAAFVGTVLLRGQTDHSFQPGTTFSSPQTAPYGLIDLDNFPADNYGYCKWGNLMSTTTGGSHVLVFTPLTQPPYSNANQDLFLSTSLTTLQVKNFPASAAWSPPGSPLDLDVNFFNRGDGWVRLYPNLSVTGETNSLLRKLHFSGGGLIDEMTGHLLSPDAKKVVILIHGWNPAGWTTSSGAAPNSYDTTEWNALTSALRGALQGQGWSLVLYHWEADADTGSQLELAVGGTQVAEIGHQHGQYLGELLRAKYPNLQFVHFVAHSAGSWAARSATKYLNANSRAIVQVTLLDPFIPASVAGVASSLTNARMKELVHFTGPGRLWQAENYYSDDGLGPAGTQDVFDWGAQGTNFLVGRTSDGIPTPFGAYGGHSGPILFYADAVAVTSGQTPVSADKIAGFDTYDLGWGRSFFRHEPVFNSLFGIAPEVAPSAAITAGFNFTLSAQAFTRSGGDAITYQWLHDGQPVGPPETRSAGATTLTIQNATDADSGQYSVRATTYGGLINESQSTTVAVTPNAPTNLTASLVSASQINLAWTDNSSHESGFKIERATTSNGPWTTIGSTPANTVAFSDTGRAASTPYYYRVRAYGAIGGDSGPSNIASASTAGAALRVDLVYPGTLTGMPLPQTQPLHIYGSGFTSASTLLFNGSIPSDPTRVRFINAGEIDYDIRTDVTAADWTVQVVNGSQSSNLGHFTVVAPPPPSVGSLSVALQPSNAVSAGAQWQVDGGGFHNSGDVVTGFTPGSHALAFKSVAGYSTPSSHSVSIVGGSVTNDTETYTAIAPSTYTLTLNYDSSQGIVSAWPPPSGGTYTAGTVVQLTASAGFNKHFTGWSGAASGTTNPTTIVMNGNKSVTAAFAAGDPTLGTVSVTIQPAAAAAAGVTWGLNATDFRSSGSTYTTFPATYLLSLHPVDGWLGPPNIVATVSAGQTTNVTATFTADTTPGLLTVTLSPPDATTAGARWHANGGAAQSNGASLSLLPGTYTVTFDAVTGWVAPASQTVQVGRSQTTVVTAAYSPPAGQPGIVSLQPRIGALTGGTTLTIQGINFVAPATVTVGGVAATNVNVVSSSQITCVTPASATYGTAAVVVQTPGGTATNQNDFAYGQPRGNGLVLAGSIGGNTNAVAAQGNFGYIGEGSTFTVLDVSNPAAPTPVGRLAMPGLIQDIALFSISSHLYAAVANDDAGLQIVDLANAAAPALRGYYGSGDRSYGVAAAGNYVCLGDGSAGFKVLDVSDPARPRLVGAAVPSSPFANRMSLQTINNQRLVYLVNNGGLQIIDLTDFTNPILRGHTNQLLQQWYVPNSIAVSGNRAFLVDGFVHLQGVDVSNPDSPSGLGDQSSNSLSAVCVVNGQLFMWGRATLETYNITNGQLQRIGLAQVSGQLPGTAIAVAGGKALCAGGEGGLYVYDVSSVSSPTFRGAYGATAGYYNYAAFSGNYAWFASQNSGLKTFDVSNPGAPTLVAQYRASFNGGFGGEGVKVSGNRAYYLASGQINVLDVSNPASPVFLGATSQSTFIVQDFYVTGTLIVAVGSDATFSPFRPSLAIFNAGNPAAISIQGRVGLLSQGGGIDSVAGNGSLAFVTVPSTSGGSYSVVVIDVSSPGNPHQIGQLADVGVVPSRSLRLAPDNQHLYVGGSSPDFAWKIIDVGNSAALVLLSTTSLNTLEIGFDFAGTTAYVATWRGIMAYDVSDPIHPQLQRSYGTPASLNDVRVSGGYLYATDGVGGLVVLAPTDIDPPVVTVTSPASNVDATSSTVNLAGTAADSAGLVHGNVTQVSWSNSRGGGGNATGLGSWTVNGIVLQPGTNVLTVTASDAAGNRGVATVTVNYQLPKQDQSITFGALANHTYGDAPITLVAAASSGLPVQFAVVSGPGVVTNQVLTLTGAGTVTVRATQPGDSAFNAAAAVDVSFNVAAANQTIAFAPLADQSAGTPSISLSASASSGLPVYFNVVSGPAVLSGNTLTLLGAGTVVVDAWQPGGSSYNAAATIERTFNVQPVPQTITFGSLNAQHVGDAPFALSATSTSGLPVSFTVVNGPATVVGSTAILTGVGNVTIRASQPGDATFAAAANVDQSFVVQPAPMAPTITEQPQGQTVSAAAMVTFTVVATGTTPLNYQWRKNGASIDGATSATLQLSNVQPAGSGSYDVVVSNGVSPDAVSSAATLNVVPAGVVTTHLVSSYVMNASGGTATIANRFTYAGAVTNLRWSVLLPTGWSLVSTDASGAQTQPAPSGTGLLEWQWDTLPPSPLTFNYVLGIPANDTTSHPLSALVAFKFEGTPIQVTAKIDPLIVGPYHSADTNHDGKLSLTELLRVIELYNTRNGSVRTGCYAVDATNLEDGFAGDPARSGTAVVTLAAYHSADANRDGKLSLTELLRIIELYNYRSGTVRTGQYHAQAGTEDGFEAGP